MRESVKPTSLHSRWTLKKALVAFICALFILVAIGVGWNFVAGNLVRGKNPPPGSLYRVNGHLMHLNCIGAGSATVVAEAGSGEDSLTWSLVQGTLAKDIRFCSYDRAGLGWSESQPGPRDARSIADQLHALLVAGEVRGPLILLGHSLGGLFIRAYAAQYPDQIVGLIFLDASTPAAYVSPEGDTLGITPLLKRAPHLNLVRWLQTVSGYARLRGDCDDYPAPMSSFRKLYQADSCMLSRDAEVQNETGAILQGIEQIPIRLADVPVLILSEDKSPTVQTPAAVAAWNRIQDSMLHLSPRSYRVIAMESDHFLQIDCPAFVADQLRKFALSLNGAPPPLPYSSTATLPCKDQASRS